MDRYKDKAFQRNYGFWNEEEQKKLSGSKVAIAGVGGDGFQLGYKLAMMGVSGFKIADPEVFEIENSNRVFGATSSNIGQNKAEVFKKMVTDIRPDVSIDIYSDGVSEENVEDFIEGADLLIDESELTRLEIGTMLARTARKAMIPDLFVMNIGFAGVATSFHPESDKTFERMMGIPNGVSIKEVADMKVDLSRCIPYVPIYGDKNALRAIEDGAPLPSISQGVDIASAIGTTEAFLHLTNGSDNNRRQPVWAPKFRYIDSYSGESGISKASRLRYYIGVVALLGRYKLGLNPSASYSDDERKSRDQF